LGDRYMGKAFAVPWKSVMIYLVPIFLAFGALWAWVKKKALPQPVLLLFVAIFSAYFASRSLAFKLYVPNRHLQCPMSVALIVAFSILLWSLFNRSKELNSTRFKEAWLSFFSMICLACVVWVGTGDGMYGDANFNYSRYKHGKVFEWLRKNTPESALVAGHPTHIDATQLFAMRKAYVTTETTHPFYPEYYKEMKRRYIISLKAHYARDWHKFVKLLSVDKIDYFVFSRKRFYSPIKDKVYSPLNEEVLQKLIKYPVEEYLYKKLPQQLDYKKAPFMVFRDDYSAVIDVNILRTWLEEREVAEEKNKEV